MYTFAHVEIPSIDPYKAAQFYGKIFSWKFEEYYGNYLLISTHDGQMIGGLAKLDKVVAPEGYYTYVEVEDVQDILMKAKSLGAKVLTERTELPGGFGSYGVFQSPDGYNLGIWSRT